MAGDFPFAKYFLIVVNSFLHAEFHPTPQKKPKKKTQQQQQKKRLDSNIGFAQKICLFLYK